MKHNLQPCAQLYRWEMMIILHPLISFLFVAQRQSFLIANLFYFCLLSKTERSKTESDVNTHTMRRLTNFTLTRDPTLCRLISFPFHNF